MTDGAEDELMQELLALASLDAFANVDVPQLRDEHSALSPPRIDAILARFHAPVTQTALELCADFLNGGIRPALGITEICGESGCGKSTFVLRLALQVQLPRSLGGLEGGAVYVSTDVFSQKRLRQLFEAMPADARLAASLERVFVQNARALDELAAIIAQLPLLMRAKSVKLVVIDSIASLFRSADTAAAADQKAALFERSNFLFSFARRLRALADEFGAAVVVTNQVSDVIAAGAAVAATDDNAAVRAALGPSWSACVTTRLALRKASGPTVVMSRIGTALERKRARVVEESESTTTTATTTTTTTIVEPTRFLSISLSSTLEAGRELSVGIRDGGLFGA